MQRFDLKLVLIGDSRVGKSQLSRSFVGKDFLEDAQVTIGIEFQSKTIEFEKSLIQAHVWDTAGQERVQGMTRAYYRKAAGAILVYDVCNRKSFENIRNLWIKQFREEGYTDVRLILVGNKTDLLDGDSPCEREVSVEEATEYAKSENIDYIETSALSGYNVDAMFRRISLSVGRLLPQVAIHLEVSDLPDGWMSCFDNSNTAADSGAASGLSVSDVSAVMMEDEIARQLSPPAQRTKSPMAAEAVTMKQLFLNYWTGEIVTERPTYPAPLSPGMLHVAKEIDINAAFGNDPRNGGLKERTSSCKTTATYLSSSSGGTNNVRLSQSQEEDYGSLSESRRSMSRSKSDSGKASGGFTDCLKSTCTVM